MKLLDELLQRAGQQYRTVLLRLDRWRQRAEQTSARPLRQPVRAYLRWVLAHQPRKFQPPLLLGTPSEVCCMTRGIAALQFLHGGDTIVITCSKCGSDVIFPRSPLLPFELVMRCVCGAHVLVRERGRIETSDAPLNSIMYIVRMDGPKHPSPEYGDEVYIDGVLHWYGPSANHDGPAWFSVEGERLR